MDKKSRMCSVETPLEEKREIVDRIQLGHMGEGESLIAKAVIWARESVDFNWEIGPLAATNNFLSTTRLRPITIECAVSSRRRSLSCGADC